jgi:hypothetical protein
VSVGHSKLKTEGISLVDKHNGTSEGRVLPPALDSKSFFPFCVGHVSILLAMIVFSRAVNSLRGADIPISVFANKAESYKGF